MSDFKKILGGAIVSVLLASCASTPVMVDTCPSADVPLAEIRPVDSGARKVVFLGFTENTIPAAKEIGAANLVESRVNVLISNAGAGIVDSTLATDLKEQIKRYEIRGESTYSSNLATDAVRIEIAKMDVSSSFSDASSYTNSDGKTIRTPAKCKFQANVSGFLKIYSVNPLKLVQTVPITGNQSTSIDSANKNCQLPSGADTSLLRSAAENGAESQEFKKGVFGYFRKAGHVREVRICTDKPKDNFVFLSLSPQVGASPGSDVNFFRQYYFEDKLADTRILRKKIVASGKIVETPNADEAWVRVDNRDDVRQLQLGDIAEVIQDSCTQQFDWMCGKFGM